jgi:hypothetical protein
MLHAWVYAWAAMIRPEARRRVRCYSDLRGEEGCWANGLGSTAERGWTEPIVDLHGIQGAKTVAIDRGASAETA